MAGNGVKFFFGLADFFVDKSNELGIIIALQFKWRGSRKLMGYGHTHGYVLGREGKVCAFRCVIYEMKVACGAARI